MSETTTFSFSERWPLNTDLTVNILTIISVKRKKKNNIFVFIFLHIMFYVLLITELNRKCLAFRFSCIEHPVSSQFSEHSSWKVYILYTPMCTIYRQLLYLIFSMIYFLVSFYDNSSHNYIMPVLPFISFILTSVGIVQLCKFIRVFVSESTVILI